MAIKVGACSVCAEAAEAYLARRVPSYSKTIGHGGKQTFTVHIASDPRNSDPKSLFAMAWNAAKGIKFPYHQTKQSGNTVYCSNY